MLLNIFDWLKATSYFDIPPCGVHSKKKIIIAPPSMPKNKTKQKPGATSAFT